MKKAVILSILLLLLFALPCYAAVYAEAVLDEDALATNNQSVSMSLVASSVQDGDIEIATNTVIELEFSKNIVHFSVLMHNKECFHLLDKNGEAVEIKLIFPDDQVQKQYKRQVFIAPTAELKSNSKYTLIVDNNLTSKNDTDIDNAYFINFTTGSEASGKQNRILAELGDDILEFTSQSGKSKYSEKIYKPLILDTTVPAADYPAVKIAGMAAAIILLIAAMITKAKSNLLD